ncbi:ABC transporter ATP-binding protein [Cognatiluteimonas profundi]|uniref:ABC transporter ATP-binding protein n=1 Tax=Cognatiluteimonas profundi TaxID=2594501 RepID=UPI00131B5F31|nr:ABC transporter ATP-binding protein [Lysobacter profundi]
MRKDPAAGEGRDARFLLALVRPYRLALLAMVALMCTQSLVALATPWLAGRFSAALLGDRPVTSLLLIWLVVIAMQACLGYVVAVRSQSVASHLVADASTRVFDHLQSLPLQWHEQRRRGEVLVLLTEDVYRLGYFVTGTVTPLMPLLLTCVGAFVLMVRVDLAIGLAVSALMPVFYIALRWTGRRLRPLARLEIEAEARKSALAEQNLAMLPIVKAFSGERAESRRYAAQSEALRRIELSQVRLQNAIGPIARILVSAFVLALLWISSQSVARGTMTAADLVTILMYGLLLAQPISQLAGVYGQVQTARATARRLMDVFAHAPEPDDGTRELRDVRGEVSLEDLHFSHAGRPPVFRGLNLLVRAGETLAITGANGAGKSTLAHLLLRLVDPQGGRISLDGVDLKELTLRNLRSHVGLVSQQVLLFNASVRDNIRYGDVDASDADIERAAGAALADGFIRGLPDGYDTIVGDQGIRLSGGQRQRIALARALLKDPAVLILDEATAMFDPDAESMFIEQCRSVLHKRTVILITHRPTTLALADRILQLEDGQLSPARHQPVASPREIASAADLREELT